MYNDFVIRNAEFFHLSDVHKERQQQDKVISHKNHLLFVGSANRRRAHPYCLDLLYHNRRRSSIEKRPCRAFFLSPSTSLPSRSERRGKATFLYPPFRHKLRRDWILPKFAVSIPSVFRRAFRAPRLNTAFSSRACAYTLPRARILFLKKYIFINSIYRRLFATSSVHFLITRKFQYVNGTA